MIIQVECCFQLISLTFKLLKTLFRVMEQENEQAEPLVLDLMQKSLLVALFICPLTYFLILYTLHTKAQATHQNNPLFSVNFVMFVLFFIILSVLSVISCRLLLIPYINKIKIKEPQRVFLLYIILITYSALDISAFGLIIGIYGFAFYGSINWFVVIPFILGGLLHEIYLYYTEIKPAFKPSVSH